MGGIKLGTLAQNPGSMSTSPALGQGLEGAGGEGNQRHLGSMSVTYLEGDDTVIGWGKRVLGNNPWTPRMG